MADYVIGFDFGNYYAQLCCIEDMDPKTRRGGTFRTLLDSSMENKWRNSGNSVRLYFLRLQNLCRW